MSRPDPDAVAPAPRRASVLLAVIPRIIESAILIMYPVLVFYGLQRWGPRALAVIFLVGLVPLFVLRALRAGGRMRSVLAITALITSLIGASAWMNEAGLMMLVPVVINGALAVTFGSTLWTATPIIERFARMQHPDLNPGEVAWCRGWTRIWTGFFVFNVLLVSFLVWLGAVELWTYYTGAAAYGIMGLLFAVEYILRKIRFKRFDGHILDRWLARGLVAVGLVDAEAVKP